jgi:nucleoside 2-deoxyribosyltransferase
MKVAVGCSMKYRDLAKETVLAMRAAGIDALFPQLFHTERNEDVSTTLEEKKAFALVHYQAVREADAVYLLTRGGHMGTSLKLELGYALALNKPIFFSEPTNDMALDCYVTKFVPTHSVQELLTD